MTYSKYQQAIFDFLEFQNGNLNVQACAGSGKSFTIKHGIKRTKPGQSIYVGAFNKHIQIPLSQEIPHFVPEGSRCTVQTFNSIGWGICRNEWTRIDLDPEKTFNILQEGFDMERRKESGQFWGFMSTIRRLVGLFKANIIKHVPNQIEVEQMIVYMGYEAPWRDATEAAAFMEHLQRTYERAINMTRIMDFDDQVFMPIYHELQTPRFNFGCIDEFQDLNPVQIELAFRLCERIMGVGDRRQAIYGFRGADVKAMENFVQRANATQLPLSICYRCPKAVVALAQKLIGTEYIQPADDAPEGIVANKKLVEFEKEVQPGDLVICRCTAPLVIECLKFIRQGRRATVKGKAIGDGLVELMKKASPDLKDQMESFIRNLTNYHMKQTDRLAKLHREGEIEILNDKIATIKVICENCNTLPDVQNKIKEIFSDQVVGIGMCTVHKVKGLENDRVWILAPELMPHPAAKIPWQKEQEINLQYVAYTRVVYRRDRSTGKPITEGELYFIN